VIQSLVSNYNHVNVEAQLAQPTSLLHWVHGMLAVRKRHPALGLGEFRAVPSDNESVLAFLRTTPTETILVVANMASTARSATLQLPDWAGAAATDVFGGAPFPPVSAEGRSVVTLGSREFYWLTLTR
jgi:maltose alpha-D-glucosyltransferase/alpha-amylase